MFAKRKKNLSDKERRRLLSDVKRTLVVMRQETEKPMIRITLDREQVPSLTDSKVGGYPYWPEGKEYPKSKEGKPLSLLAQINLCQLPDNPWLPKEGMLQFLIGDSDLYGSDDFKVVFHEKVDARNAVAGMELLTSLNDTEYILPVSGEIKMTFSEATCSINECDYAFHDIFERTAKKLNLEVGDRVQFYSLLGEDYEKYIPDTSGHHMFGYPYFTQSDPRGPGSPYDTVLFQLDSDWTRGSGQTKNSVMWGDSGIGLFFINSKALRDLNFEDVLFYWDCC